MLDTIFSAHARSSARAAGRHVKILRRLGVSDTPVTFDGPAITSAFMCGNAVMP